MADRRSVMDHLGHITKYIKEFPHIFISFTPCRLNRRADWVAINTRTRTLPQN
ncbi:hypothetical protein LINPERHAP2_LOCUS34010 [Linum perenne]